MANSITFTHAQWLKFNDDVRQSKSLHNGQADKTVLNQYAKQDLGLNDPNQLAAFDKGVLKNGAQSVDIKQLISKAVFSGPLGEQNAEGTIG